MDSLLGWACLTYLYTYCFRSSFGSTEIGEIHCFHYTRQVGVVSYLVRAIEGIIRMCLAGESKDGPQSAGSSFLVY